MILKQLIRYTNAAALEATWVEVIEVPQEQDPTHDTYLPPIQQEVVVKCQAYANSQMDMLAADLGADAPQFQALMDEIAATYVEPEPEPIVVPTEVTMRQARLALLGAGLLSVITSAINSLPSPQKEAAQIEWEYSQTVQRHNGFVSQLALVLGLTSEQIDALFIAAVQL